MTGALAADSPLQALTSPRAIDELSAWIDAVAPVGIHQNARVWNRSVPATASTEDPRDSWQRSILFMNVLRQCGNQYGEMLARCITSALVYDSELVMRGDGLPHAVNYSLVRIIPPEGVEINDRKRAVFVIDPGQLARDARRLHAPRSRRCRNSVLRNRAHATPASTCPRQSSQRAANSLRRSAPHERDFVFARGWSSSAKQGGNRYRMRAAAASKCRKEEMSA